MGWEIERRFLVRTTDTLWVTLADGHHLRQGYIRTGQPSVRIRTGEPRGAVLTCKSGKGIRRSEVEAVVPDEIADALFAAAESRIIQKIRWRLGPWELDRFVGALDGLELLEIELDAEGQVLPGPPEHVHVLREVTDDKRFVSGHLARMTPKDQQRLVRKAYKEAGRMTTPQRLAALPFVLALGACTMIGGPGTVARRPADPADIPDLVPRDEPPSSDGNMAEYEQGGRTYRVLESSYGYDERGLASWYGEDFHGRPTSSREPYDMYALSGAHRTLPLPTYVRVTNLGNGSSVIVRVNDRGPFADPDTRIIDVSYAAAVRLGMVGTGTAMVRVEAVEPWQYRR